MPVLTFSSQQMTPEIMEELENKGLIIRLCPSRPAHRLKVEPATGAGRYLYTSAESSGTHALMTVAIDNSEFTSFGSHPDNEEFLLLGGIDEKKLYLLIALISDKELNEKIYSRQLTENDFICLETVFNDPQLSFFIMKKGVPHGECSGGSGLPATFYVTEGSKLTIERTDFRNYTLEITA